MRKTDDFAMANEEKDYCKFCCNSDGTMQSYNDKLKSMTEFLIKTEGLLQIEAVDKAKSYMLTLPAWKNI